MRFLGARVSPVPAGASYYMDLTWFRFAGGRLVVGRGRRTLWHSRGRFGFRGLGAIRSTQRSVAFSYVVNRRTVLYVAQVGRAERQVARGETPLLWTADDRLVTSQGPVLRLRDRNGRLRHVLSGAASDVAVDDAARHLYYVDGALLKGYSGGRVKALADLRRLGVGRTPSLTPAGRFLAVTAPRRLVVLGRDGVVASTPLRRAKLRTDTSFGAFAADSDGTVAFTATTGNTAYGSRGVESVYLLRPGATRAARIYRHRIRFKVCERQASLAWRRGWILYSNPEGYVAAIDARGGRAVDLRPLVRRLPGHGGDVFDARWS